MPSLITPNTEHLQQHAKVPQPIAEQHRCKFVHCMSTRYSAELDPSYFLNIRTHNATRNILSTNFVPDIFSIPVRQTWEHCVDLSSIAQP